MPAKSHKDEQYDERHLVERAPSVAHSFRSRCAADADRDAFLYFSGDVLHHVSWSEAKEVVDDWAAGLVALGLGPEDRVSIVSNTRYEWVIADLAIMCAGGATTTVYPTSGAADVAFIVGDSSSRIVVAEDAGQVEKLRARRAELPDVMKVVCLDRAGLGGDGDDWVIGVDELVRLGRERLAAEPSVVDDRIAAITPDKLATIIYTSGTTGRPKGAELTHDCFVYEGAAVASLNFIGPQDLQYLWLPLSHVFGKVLLSIALDCGCPTAIDGRVDKIVDNLAVVRPTWMGAAPRIFEKAKAKVGFTFAEATGAKAKLIGWAMEVGRQVSEARTAGRTPAPHLLAQYAVADALVLRKVRERFGGRVRFFISGSAPLDPDVARWFHSVGMLIIEGYGLTETTAATCVNRPFEGSYGFGTIGWPVPGTDVRIGDDGELLVKGPGVMRGYHNSPDLTAEVMTPDGYFRTGDIAEIDDRGFVRITDRKKDVFKTSGGKYVAPALIEAQFKGLCPYVSQFVVVGAGRNYASALVTLDPEAIRSWASANGVEGSYADIAGSDAARDMVQGYVDELNAGLNRWETIKRFTILDRDFSVEDGEMTPSMKLKRNVVKEHFQGAIDDLYAQD